MGLLYFANQLGRKISKLSFVESEYLRAIIVSGHIFLKIINTIPSPIISAIPIQTNLSILLTITA